MATQEVHTFKVKVFPVRTAKTGGQEGDTSTGLLSGNYSQLAPLPSNSLATAQEQPPGRHYHQSVVVSFNRQKENQRGNRRVSVEVLTVKG